MKKILLIACFALGAVACGPAANTGTDAGAADAGSSAAADAGE